MAKRPLFVNDTIYHIYNRGVEKRNIFTREKDYFRFVHNLYEFNDEAPAENLFYKLPAFKSYEVGLRKRQRKCLVEIFAFCLMPNHYHLMLRQKVDNGITEFMRKLGTGYTNYFNLKYDRVGPLFQGKFKAVLLEKEAHFIHLPHYIHLNPLSLIIPSWQEKGVKDVDRVMDFLKKYKWSSLPDYLGLKNWSLVIERNFLQECIGRPVDFLRDTREWIKDRHFDFVQNLTFEYELTKSDFISSLQLPRT